MTNWSSETAKANSAAPRMLGIEQRQRHREEGMDRRRSEAHRRLFEIGADRLETGADDEHHIGNGQRDMSDQQRVHAAADAAPDRRRPASPCR